MAKTTTKKVQISFYVPADKVNDLLSTVNEWCGVSGSSSEVGYIKNHATAAADQEAA